MAPAEVWISSLESGATYHGGKIDMALKALFRTDLFSDVKIDLRGGENRQAGRHDGDNALKNDASRARIQIGSRIRHAGDREIQQCERQQDIFLCSIHPGTLGALGTL